MPFKILDADLRLVNVLLLPTSTTGLLRIGRTERALASIA